MPWRKRTNDNELMIKVPSCLLFGLATGKPKFEKSWLVIGNKGKAWSSSISHWKTRIDGVSELGIFPGAIYFNLATTLAPFIVIYAVFSRYTLGSIANAR